MVDAIVDFRIGVACAFGAKFPYSPVVAMLGVEEFHKRIERVAVCALGIGAAGTRCCDDYAWSTRDSQRLHEPQVYGRRSCTVICDIAEVEAGFSVSGARAGDYLAK